MAPTYLRSVQLDDRGWLTSPPTLPTSQLVLRRVRPSTPSPKSRMASDEDYMAFLDKANKDVDDGKAYAAEQSQRASKATFKALDSGSQVPKAIKDVCKDTVYVTDADEPFEEVSLKWDGDGGLPDESMIHHHPSAYIPVNLCI